MRASEFISENMSRRGFLGAMGAAAATAATGANAGQFMGMADFGMQRFMQESAKLEKRMAPIFQKLVAASGPDAPLLSKVKLSAESVFGSAEADPFGDGKIILDVTVFYDLPDDALAYTIAHEMGHLALKHKFGKNVSVQTARQYELQADVYGAKLAYKCGYDPKQAFAEMTAAEKRARTQSTATHPDYQTRKTHVQQQTGVPVAAINTLQHNRMAIRNFMLA
jgi:Zn-dependent protease with chaperone function